MAKPKGPKWDETRDADRVEVRAYHSHGGSSRMGRSTVIITCPFCKDSVTAFIWSLCGGGKRCDCGALFGSLGSAYHFKEQARE